VNNLQQRERPLVVIQRVRSRIVRNVILHYFTSPFKAGSDDMDTDVERALGST
jgi:hypothetical protein